MHTYPSVYGAYGREAASCTVLCLDQLDARALHFLDDLTYMRLVWKRLRKPTGNAVSPVLNTSGTKFGNGIQPLEDKQKHHLFHLLVPFSVSYGNEIVSFVRWFYKLLSHVSLLFLVLSDRESSSSLGRKRSSSSHSSASARCSWRPYFTHWNVQSSFKVCTFSYFFNSSNVY